MIGTVLAIYASPGPASAIRYKVRLNLPDGTTRELDHVASHAGAPPDDYDSVGTQPGMAFEWDLLEDRTMQLLIPCFPDSIDCEDL